MGCRWREGKAGWYCGVVIAASSDGYKQYSPKHVGDILCIIDNVVVL